MQPNKAIIFFAPLQILVYWRFSFCQSGKIWAGHKIRWRRNVKNKISKNYREQNGIMWSKSDASESKEKIRPPRIRQKKRRRSIKIQELARKKLNFMSKIRCQEVGGLYQSVLHNWFYNFYYFFFINMKLKRYNHGCDIWNILIIC